MYSPRISALSAERLAETFHVAPLAEHTIAEVEDWTERLADAAPPAKGDGSPTRELAREEHAFILNERIVTKASFEYWASRYAFCSVEGAGIKRMYPLFDSQVLALQEFARIEEQIADSQLAEGILVNALKARRLGMSTLAQASVWHRL